MRWPEGLPFSIKNDHWIDVAKYVNLKDMKWEATFAITFAIAEGDYETAEEIAFVWISNDCCLNKLGASWQIEDYLKGWEKFSQQAKYELPKSYAKVRGQHE
jgi:hypothetical protein